MNALYQVKHQIKRFRWRARRTQAAIWRGAKNLSDSPIVLGNAIPKSGSHLITQVLRGLSKIGPFVNAGFPPVNREEGNAKVNREQITSNIREMRSGDIGYGYLPCEQPFIDLLTPPGHATVFIHRDPRDVVVSSAFYISKINPNHALHAYYAMHFNSIEECINAEINGIQDSAHSYPDIRTRFERYTGWLEQASVLSLRFEEIILDRDAALNKLLDYLEARGAIFFVPRHKSLAVLHSTIQPKKSGTFRKGQPGNWREHFTEQNKELFKAKAGDLLARLGHEKDNNW